MTGMSVKFEPVPGTDTINNKNGVSQTVATKLYCISAMKQYETQSLEVSNLISLQTYIVITHKPLSSLYFQIVHNHCRRSVYLTTKLVVKVPVVEGGWVWEEGSWETRLAA